MTPDAVRRLVDDAAAANMNMLRVWGGGLYYRDEFYDACDAAGLMVWQEAMFACSLYPADRAFLDDVRARPSCLSWRPVQCAERSCLCMCWSLQSLPRSMQCLLSSDCDACHLVHHTKTGVWCCAKGSGGLCVLCLLPLLARQGDSLADMQQRRWCMTALRAVCRCARRSRTMRAASAATPRWRSGAAATRRAGRFRDHPAWGV